MLRKLLRTIRNRINEQDQDRPWEDDMLLPPEVYTPSPTPRRSPMTDVDKIGIVGEELGHDLFITCRPCYTYRNSKQFDPGPCFESFFYRLYQHSIQNIVVLMPRKDILAEYGFDIIEVYEDAGYEVLHYPIKDFDVPSSFLNFHRAMEETERLLGKANTVVHCSAGKGRSGLFVAGFLVYLDYYAEDAINSVREDRSGTVETKAQEEFVYDYQDFLDSSPL